MGMDGRKNCLVAGIKHTNRETVGMAILTRTGMGAMTKDKSMKAARAGYWTSSHVQRCLWMARTPSHGFKEVCSLVMSEGSSRSCRAEFLGRDRLLLLAPGVLRWNLSGILTRNAWGHCRCGICNLDLV